MESISVTDRDERYRNRRISIRDIWDLIPEFIRPTAKKVIKKSNVRPYIDLLFNSPLRDRGWFDCYQGAPADQHNNPLPWMPYSFIDFVSERLDSSMSVFEYGSGNSTRWFADHVSEVKSVEHSRDWYEKVSESLPSNVELIHQTGDDYVTAIEQYGDFEVVIIDGEEIAKCADIAAGHLTSDGVIIWDDTFSEENKRGMRNFTEGEFKQLYFQGMGPVSSNLQRTSVLYRDTNHFGI